jgi:glycerone phosphate O-acyltransferase
MFSFLPQDERNAVIEVVNGDTAEANAGIDDASLDNICRRNSISHIFHCAADVSFTQTLSDAAAANISSSLNVQCLASRITKTKVQFVHISTAFVHGGLSGSIEDPLPEELYSLGKFDPQEIYKSMCNTQFYAYKAMSELCFPNTYTFSKCVCEHMLMQNDPSTIIIRPSIVGPAVEAPYEGWVGQTPSTLVAAACLCLSYQWNIWSFGTQRVPCIPVDVLSRYILAKTFQADSFSKGKGPDEASSDGSYEKMRNFSVSFSSFETGSDSVSSQTNQIYTAAWNVESPRDACFTWLDYAGAVFQVGAVLGHRSRPMAYIALFVATRLLPKASLSIAHFERLHIWCVQYPFKIFLSISNLLGQDTTSTKRLFRLLDLPLLFYPFMNNDFHFHSDLVAPREMSGERYCLKCVAAAHFFVTRAQRRNRNRIPRQKNLGNDCDYPAMSFLQIAGSTYQGSSGFWWALTQPRGNFFVQFAGWILSKILRACFSEVTVDAASFAATIKAIDSQSSTCIILAPTHRSFFDFLLLSYVGFAVPELQINIPFIAAAGEFERLPFLGYFMQLLGAFFVFRGRTEVDPRLVETLSSIRRNCCNARSTIEVFIEGTRSRDRRFVKPKTGVLRCLKETGGIHTIIPISISYERIPEQQVLANEAAGGIYTGLRIGAVWHFMQVSDPMNVPQKMIILFFRLSHCFVHAGSISRESKSRKSSCFCLRPA